MPDRPHISKSFSALEELVDTHSRDINLLTVILDELSHRTRNRHVPSLQQRIEQLISVANNYSPNAPTEAVDFDESTAKYDFELHQRNEIPAVFVPENWDAEQRTVIELDEGDTKIVEAGPGAGKTAVACARVAYLIEQCDLEASKIFLISFTRTAVKELRDRIEAFAEDPVSVAGLQIFTLDSFTWQVLRGLGDDESADLMGSYETNIKRFIQQLKDGEEQLLDYLAEFEHVILDEGQDLVGDRAELALQIISNLEEGCGVTVFADSAQAIYGFTDDSEEHGMHSSLTVVERIMAGEIEGFDRKKLVNVHRTDDPKLTCLFTEGRDRLIDRKESNFDEWKGVKQLITDCAHGSIEEVKPQYLAGKSDQLVLFRTRSEVLMASSFLWSDGIVHKLRMSGIPQHVLLWIGRLFGDVDEDFIDHEKFVALWASAIDSQTHICSQSCADAWSLLIDNVGDNQGRVKVTRLREILSRDRPPIDFLVDESRLAGPVLGTIHASKGREASQVHLMLPPDKFIDTDSTSPFYRSPKEIAEEERVLFVGATRAKHKLLVGQGKRLCASRLDKRRTFRPPHGKKDRCAVEIGLTGDIDLVSIADGRLQNNLQELQIWLWENSNNPVNLEIHYDFDLKANVLKTADNSQRTIAIMNSRFDKDLWLIAEKLAVRWGTKKLRPGLTIRHIRMVGATTVVIPEAQRDQLQPPWRHSGFILAPVITGFPMVFFNNWKQK